MISDSKFQDGNNTGIDSQAYHSSGAKVCGEIMLSVSGLRRFKQGRLASRQNLMAFFSMRETLNIGFDCQTILFDSLPFSEIKFDKKPHPEVIFRDLIRQSSQEDQRLFSKEVHVWKRPNVLTMQ